MTEEIIIDCAFYKDGVCASPINKTCEYCKNIDVSKCYHKQLKRLEQKNFELEESLKVFNRPDVNRVLTLYKVGDIDLLEKKCDRLEQENKELKEENERLKKDFSSYEDDIEDWVSDNSILYQYDDRTPDTLEELQACMESTHEQWQKYKQALKEIRTISDKFDYWNSDLTKASNIVGEIKDKINECLGE